MEHLDQIFRQARRAEQEGNWRRAEDLWNSIRRFSDARACALIAEAIEEGDAFRQEVADTLGECPELTLNTLKEVKDWNEKMNEIYKKHFKS
jgi:hypothetical protein